MASEEYYQPYRPIRRDLYEYDPHATLDIQASGAAERRRTIDQLAAMKSAAMADRWDKIADIPGKLVDSYQKGKTYAEEQRGRELRNEAASAQLEEARRAMEDAQRRRGFMAEELAPGQSRERALMESEFGEKLAAPKRASEAAELELESAREARADAKRRHDFMAEETAPGRTREKDLLVAEYGEKLAAPQRSAEAWAMEKEKFGMSKKELDAQIANWQAQHKATMAQIGAQYKQLSLQSEQLGLAKADRADAKAQEQIDAAVFSQKPEAIQTVSASLGQSGYTPIQIDTMTKLAQTKYQGAQTQADMAANLQNPNNRLVLDQYSQKAGEIKALAGNIAKYKATSSTIGSDSPEAQQALNNAVRILEANGMTTQAENIKAGAWERSGWSSRATMLDQASKQFAEDVNSTYNADLNKVDQRIRVKPEYEGLRREFASYSQAAQGGGSPGKNTVPVFNTPAPQNASFFSDKGKPMGQPPQVVGPQPPNAYEQYKKGK